MCSLTRMAETLADRVRQRLEIVGKSAHAASLEAGGSPSLIPNILHNRSANPRGDTLQKLATVLGVSEHWLLTGEDGVPRNGEVRPADVTLPDRAAMPKDVPVYGTVAGSELGKGAFQLTSDVVDYVRRPPGLVGARDAYALYVEGESMLPKFEPGELVYVHPHRKVRPLDYVVIQEPDSDNGEPRGFIKQYVKQTTKLLHTRQFNPEAQVDFILRPGLRWHKVLNSNELMGV